MAPSALPRCAGRTRLRACHNRARRSPASAHGRRRRSNYFRGTRARRARRHCSPRSSSTARACTRRRNCSPRTATSSAGRIRASRRAPSPARSRDLYVRDGYVKPEFTLDDALTSRGVLRLQVYEAQVTSVIFEGDGGRFNDALDGIGSRLENARPLRKDDVRAGAARHAPDRGPRRHGDHATRSGRPQCIRARGAGGLLADRRRGAHEQPWHGPGGSGVHARPGVCQRLAGPAGEDSASSSRPPPITTNTWAADCTSTRRSATAARAATPCSSARIRRPTRSPSISTTNTPASASRSASRSRSSSDPSRR